jgi:hypothetical protein
LHLCAGELALAVQRMEEAKRVRDAARDEWPRGEISEQDKERLTKEYNAVSAKHWDSVAAKRLLDAEHTKLRKALDAAIARGQAAPQGRREEKKVKQQTGNEANRPGDEREIRRREYIAASKAADKAQFVAGEAARLFNRVIAEDEASGAEAQSPSEPSEPSTGQERKKHEEAQQEGWARQEEITRAFGEMEQIQREAAAPAEGAAESQGAQMAPLARAKPHDPWE